MKYFSHSHLYNLSCNITLSVILLFLLHAYGMPDQSGSQALLVFKSSLSDSTLPDDLTTFLGSSELVATLNTNSLDSVMWIGLLDLIDNHVASNPDSKEDIRVRMIQAHAQYALGKSNEATAQFFSRKDSLSLRPWLEWSLSILDKTSDKGASLYFTGDAQARLGYYDDALASFSHAIKENSSSCLLYNARGTVYAILKKLDESYVDFKAATELCSNNPDVWANLGLVEFEWNLQAGIKDKFFIAHSKDSSHAFTLNGLALYYAKENQPQKVESYLNKALKVQPQNPFVVSNALELNKQSDSTSFSIDEQGIVADSTSLIRNMKTQTMSSVRKSFDLSRMRYELNVNLRNGVTYRSDVATSKVSNSIQISSDYSLGYPRFGN